MANFAETASIFMGNPIHDSEQKIIDAGKELLQKVQMSSCWIVWDLTSVIAITAKTSRCSCLAL